jgi:hypothetical protein
MPPTLYSGYYGDRVSLFVPVWTAILFMSPQNLGWQACTTSTTFSVEMGGVLSSPILGLFASAGLELWLPDSSLLNRSVDDSQWHCAQLLGDMGSWEQVGDSQWHCAQLLAEAESWEQVGDSQWHCAQLLAEVGSWEQVGDSQWHCAQLLAEAESWEQVGDSQWHCAQLLAEVGSCELPAGLSFNFHAPHFHLLSS